MITLRVRQMYAPQLRWISLSYAWQSLTSASLSQFLRNMPNIHGISLAHDWRTVINECILIQLLSLPRLKYLRLDDRQRLSLEVVKLSDLKLTKIQSLHLREGEVLALKYLLPQLSHLKHLELSIPSRREDPDLHLVRDILLPVSHCSNLIILDVNSSQPCSITDEAFTALARGCRKLREVCLRVSRSVPYVYPPLKHLY